MLPFLAPPVLQAPAPPSTPASKPPVALDLKAPEGIADELEAELRARLEQFGLQVSPEAAGMQVLRLRAELESQKDGTFLARVTTLRGTREELAPRHDAEGRPAGPWPQLAYLAIGGDRQLAERGLEKASVQAALTATQDLIPPPSRAKGGTPGGVVGGVVGGTGLALADYQPLKVRAQPPKAPYPIFARIAKVQGVVKMDLRVDETGVPTEAIWLSGPQALAPAALAWGLAWRFEPEVFHGKKVASSFRLSVNYELK